MSEESISLVCCSSTFALCWLALGVCGVYNEVLFRTHAGILLKKDGPMFWVSEGRLLNLT